MDDFSGFLGFILVLLVVGFGSCSEGYDMGERRAKCSTHAEYTKTGADTLALVQKYPECAPLLFPKK